MGRIKTLPLLVALCLVAGTACSSDDPVADATPERPAELVPGDSIPDAADPVLTVRDRDGSTIAELDLDTIEAMGTVRATIHEPWFKHDVEFEGVWLTDVLAVLDIEGDIDLIALDDYLVEMPVDAIRSGDALLATRADGAPIGIDDGGPTRIVFLDPDGPGEDHYLWIWSIDAIAVA